MLQDNVGDVDGCMQRVCLSNLSGSLYGAYEAGNRLLDGVSMIANGYVHG